MLKNQKAIEDFANGKMIPIKHPHIYRNPGTAAVLSFFFVGLGQIYNGEIGRGLGFFFGCLLSICATAIIVGFITTPIIWIWAIYDAYQRANLQPKGVNPKLEQFWLEWFDLNLRREKSL